MVPQLYNKPLRSFDPIINPLQGKGTRLPWKSYVARTALSHDFEDRVSTGDKPISVRGAWWLELMTTQVTK